MILAVATQLLALASSAQDASPPRIISVATSPPSPVSVQPGVAVPPGPPPIPAPRVVRSPQQRGGTAQSLISPLDYPASARDSGAEGNVDFTVTVDTNGRVIGCQITRSSGSPILDAATCRLIRSRARYTPAIDSNGNPTVGKVAEHVEWKIQR
jgi:protein TonB